MTGSLFTMNGKIAVRPPDVKGMTVKANRGFALGEQKVELTKLEVVFPYFAGKAYGLALGKGDFVYVRGEYAQLVASSTQVIAGETVVFIEDSTVYMVERP